MVKRVRQIGKGYHSVVYLGLLTLRGSRRVPVAYKILNSLNIRPPLSMMAEAVVLQLVQGVRGVPKLYGVTDSPPQALIMMYCPGKQLETFHTPRTARTFLASLQKVCRMLIRMHALGVSHGDIHQKNIMVQAVEDTEKVTVYLVDFGEAQIINDEMEKRQDTLNLFYIARSYVKEIDKYLYPGMHRRRHRILEQQDASLDLNTVSALICNILHGCFCPDPPTASLLPCHLCSASEDSQES